jgi:hypothetical protein
MIGRYGNKTELGKRFSAEHSNDVWPDWLVNVASEAVQGWVPRRADSFERLSKVSCFVSGLFNSQLVFEVGNSIIFF